MSQPTWISLLLLVVSLSSCLIFLSGFAEAQSSGGNITLSLDELTSCFLANSTPTVLPMPSNKAELKGFYINNVSNASQPTQEISYLVICPPTQECVTQRLEKRSFCPPQGKFDIAVLNSGYYCDNFFDANCPYVCPAGYYCPVGGSKIECSAFSHCPEGSIRELFFGSLFALIIVGVFLALVLYYVLQNVAKIPEATRKEMEKQLRREEENLHESRSKRKKKQKEEKEKKEKEKEEQKQDGGEEEVLEKGDESNTKEGEEEKSNNDKNNNNNYDNDESDGTQSIGGTSAGTAGTDDDESTSSSVNNSFSGFSSGAAAAAAAAGGGGGGGGGLLGIETPSSPSLFMLSPEVAKADRNMRELSKYVRMRYSDSLDVVFKNLSVSVDVSEEEQQQQEQEQEADRKEMQEQQELQQQQEREQKQEEGESEKEVKQEEQKQDENNNNYKDDDKKNKESRRKILLHPFSGRIRSGKFTAILGGSGAGKTLLSSSILRRLDRNTYHLGDGSVTLENSNASVSISSIDKIKEYCSLTPQDDILHSELSVYENIYFSSEARLPRTFSQEQKEDLRHLVLDSLQLIPHAQKLVGSALSGGQRKRVSIAVELAVLPAMLVLDEPTSGLDSSVALRVAHLLKRLTDCGIPILVILHQPRSEIFDLVDDLILMAQGGRCAFRGPARDALDYFRYDSGLDLTFATNNDPLGFWLRNPADILLDIVTEIPDQCAEAWSFYESKKNKKVEEKKKVEEEAEEEEKKEEEQEKKMEVKQEKKVDEKKSITTTTHNVLHEPMSHEKEKEEDTHAVEVQDIEEEEEEEETKKDKEKEKEEEKVARVLELDAAEIAEKKKEEEKEEVKKQPNPLQQKPQQQQQQHQQQEREREDDYNRISLLSETFLMIQRRTLKHANSPILLLNDFLMTGFCATIACLSVLDGEWGAPVKGIFVFLSAKFENEKLFALGLFVCIGIAASGGAAAVRVFGNSKAQICEREVPNGHSLVAIFIGYSFVEFIRVLFLSLEFSFVAHMMMTKLALSFGPLFGAVFCFFIFIDSLGSLIGTIATKSSARLLSLIFCVLAVLPNGFTNLPGIPFVSPSFYATSWLVRAELQKSLTVFDFASLTENFEDYPSDIDEDKWIGFGILVFVAWFLILKLILFWVLRRNSIK